MSRRPALFGLAAIAVAAAGPLVSSASAADTAPVLPRAGCFTVTDPAGDASFDRQSQLPNDDDMDILGVAYRTTPTSLQAYVKVAKLAAGPTMTDGHRYSWNFGFAGHIFAASGSAYKNGTGAIRDGLAQTGQAGHTTQLGVDVPSLTQVPPATSKGFVDSGLKVNFDTTNSWVIFDLPLADITKNAGKALTPGTKLTDMMVVSTSDVYAVGEYSDTTVVGNATVGDGVWKAGDNACFGKPKKKK